MPYMPSLSTSLRLCLLVLAFLAGGCASMPSSSSAQYNVRAFGATGNGVALDTAAVNRAIDAAHDAGGGTVLLPPGQYLCYSIHLKSNITLYLEQGATIVAAGNDTKAEYDAPEPNANDRYEDFGHSHWHNSLIWGENIDNVTIEGPGLIWGKGLSRGTARPSTQPSTTRPANRGGGSNNNGARPSNGSGGFAGGGAGPGNGGRFARGGGRGRNGLGYTPGDPATMPILTPCYTLYYPTTTQAATLPGASDGVYPSTRDTLASGIGNKSISLKNCRHITLRDISILHGGHFGILATGVDDFTIDNMRIDTNRDGMDIDSCRNVRISNCSVNSPWDDGICLKSDYALGYNRMCENLTITNCFVSGGYEEGTLINSKFIPIGPLYTPRAGQTGRIKFGTESNGGFKNIAISNCVFDKCQGLAIESVDGAIIEDVTITNISMRDIVSTPIFIRLGSRLRGPYDPPVGKIRRINISNIVATNASACNACIISGIPGAHIEDIRLSNIQVTFPGGASPAIANIIPAERENAYPEPAMFGFTPSYGFFIRHVKNLEMNDIEVKVQRDDYRPPFFLSDVEGADFVHVRAATQPSVPHFQLYDVKDFSSQQYKGFADKQVDATEEDAF